MVEEVLPGIFRVKVPLPNNPLKYTNSYFLLSGGKCLVVDTGFNVDESYDSLATAMQKLKGLGVSEFEFFSTHLHADHMGLIGRFSSSIWMSSVEAEWIKAMSREPRSYWVKVVEFYVKNGLPMEVARLMLKLHPGVRYVYRWDLDFRKLDDGDTITVGGFSLQCILTPGHTPGHMCLYDADKKVLFSGDHVLFDITPNISWMPGFKDPLNEYVKSLEKLLSLDVELVMPGHRGLGNDLRKRVRELKDHHERRLQEALTALDRPKTAWEVAPSISWDIEVKDLNKLPVTQKWFIIGETIAHLEHLLNKGKICKVEKESVILYYS
jgi:glyoxylase-like metal-dependent hydrolase (beta-lactamase superfamily II)